MATVRNNPIPKKGTIIINPKTSRPVRVGGKTWLKLVKEGIVSGLYSDDKELGTLPEMLGDEEVEEEIKKANEGLPRHQQAVRGRGRYKGKIVKRNRRLQPQEIVQASTKVVSNNIEALAEIADNEDEDIEAMLQKMILDEMIGVKASVPKPRRGWSATRLSRSERGQMPVPAPSVRPRPAGSVSVRGRPKRPAVAPVLERYEEVEPRYEEGTCSDDASELRSRRRGFASDEDSEDSSRTESDY